MEGEPNFDIILYLADNLIQQDFKDGQTKYYNITPAQKKVLCAPFGLSPLPIDRAKRQELHDTLREIKQMLGPESIVTEKFGIYALNFTLRILRDLDDGDHSDFRPISTPRKESNKRVR